MKNYLKVLSLFSTMGIATIGITATAYISIVLKSDTNYSNKTRTKDIIPKILSTKNYIYKKDLISEEQFSKKIDEDKKVLEQNFKNTTKPNSWKIFRRTKIVENTQSLSNKSEIDLQNEFKTTNLKIRALLYIQETPSSWTKEQNQEYYSSQTQKWSKQIAKKLTNLLRIEQSSFSPFVNFIFKDFNDKEKNLDILQNEKQIKVAFSYENLKVKKPKPSRMWTYEEMEEYQEKVRIRAEARESARLALLSVFESIFKNANLEYQLNRDRSNYYCSSYYYSCPDLIKTMKIGILEASNHFIKTNVAFVDGSLDTFTTMETTIISRKSSNDKFSKHANLVAAIAAGKNGVNVKATIYSANLNNGLQSSIEWMMKNGVKIINHSYGPKNPETLYDEKTYYMDFIARKYNIINVYAAGNEGRKDKPKINGNTLSINSIVVGGLDKKSVWKSSFSNFGIFNGGNNYLDKLPKPLVSIDSDGFDTSIIPNYPRPKDRGTSFAAPIVTGALSLIMRDFDYVDRAEEAMAIIAASATKLYDPDSKSERNWEGSGFNKYVGSGRLNFVNLKKAAKNLRSYTITKNGRISINAGQIFLNKGEKIAASLAWLYNAGFSKKYNWKPIEPTRPTPLNWWWLLSPWVGSVAYLNDLNNWKDDQNKWKNDVKNWDDENNSEIWKSKKIAFDKLKELRLFTDYDLKLKYYDENKNTWNKVDYSNSTYSNVELLRYKARNDGIYKLEIVKYDKSYEFYEGTPDDVLAVSYVKE